MLLTASPLDGPQLVLGNDLSSAVTNGASAGQSLRAGSLLAVSPSHAL